MFREFPFLQTSFYIPQKHSERYSTRSTTFKSHPSHLIFISHNYPSLPISTFKVLSPLIPITTFMIAQDPYLQKFVNAFTEANQGKAFYTGLKGLGEMIFEDYETNRKKKLK